ncbi:MAG: 4Fe-4S dicluster domain-containing protein [Candidatus Reddybacter sp.]
MDRRDFFKSIFRSTTREVVKHADAKVNKAAQRWIRPPYALNELDFLLACTRCGDCIPACPHNVIFPLSARVGVKAVGTPALDLLNKGCHLCSDWPCVQACGEGALNLPELISNQQSASEELESSQESSDNDSDNKSAAATAQPLPKLASASINKQSCLPYSGPECGACEASCPVPGALLWDGHLPLIDNTTCVGCGLCRQACIMQPSAINIAARQDEPSP